jgi:hypothetical protein
MTRVNSWVLCILLVALAAVPALAGDNDAAPAKSSTTATATAGSTPAAANSTGTASTPGTAPAAAPSSAVTNPTGSVTALLGVLVMKGVLSPTEAKSIDAASPEVKFQALVDVLTSKGVMTTSDLALATATHTEPAVPPVAAPAAAPAGQPALTSAELIDALYDPEGQLGGPEHPAVVPAIAPVRVLPIDGPGKGALKAAFQMGPVKMTPYGFLKATAEYDTSSPNGDDFPFVGLFLSSTNVLSTGPSLDPEFHIKARSSRIGANFEWPDASPKLVFTGRIEGDYEGNFSEVDNRDVSSIRSNAFQLRLAYVRMDYNASDRTNVYFEGGQDWTLFGSSLLPNLLETTFLGAFYGTIYERSPQFQVGWVQKLTGSVKFSPTFAIMMPSSGQIEKLGSLGLEGQIAQGEREGADSGRPEIEGRAAIQFQLDHAAGVAPAQLLIAGFQGRRTSIADNGSTSYAALPVAFRTAFPNGFTASSSMYGGQIGAQLPTRWFTVVISAYRGGDLRFFFGGQVNSFATDVGGLTNVQGPLETLDGGPLAAAGGAALGINGAGQIVVAPQRPIRSYGGFINVGFPLSRLFNARPDGHNAGWQLYLHAGKDQVVGRDITNPNFAALFNPSNPLPLSMGKLGAATLYYKVNPWCTFGIEQSIYATRLDAATGAAYTIAGRLSNEWQDHRTEFGPIFTF